MDKMNERIKELAEQAALYAVSENSSMLFDVWKKRYTEKFAELLIEECIDYCSENLSKTVGHALRIHFGVD